MQSFTNDEGIRLAYDVVGEGPPLLLHLGAGCDTGLWQAAGYLEPLATSNTCILFDHRGHGESDRPSSPEANHVDRFVADVLALLGHLRLDAVAFWGYSNAVSVALKLAEERPERLTGIIASGGIVAPPLSRAELEERVAAAAERYRRTGWEGLIEAFVDEEGEVPPWMLARIRATEIDPVIGWTEARLDWGWNAWDALARVRTPTLFLIGELEDPDDLMDKAARAMPDGRRVRIPGKGHINGFLDADAALSAAVPFLDELRA